MGSQCEGLGKTGSVRFTSCRWQPGMHAALEGEERQSPGRGEATAEHSTSPKGDLKIFVAIEETWWFCFAFSI